ncbi:MAG: hypothetical protein KKD64_02340 [Alphaproteobacteria bacterium]|nr:hypothetical protein [Alphaproteobacteria bacterium]MBU0794557.1 hypothetical protein [Alphaproteobacteria bacterium]MBU0877051.1 hypothetical protein [Alphaproteobacteria bacterium]MBU1768477.1 hypothetical protein [Alphaproteobacteria bacterium]
MNSEMRAEQTEEGGGVSLAEEASRFRAALLGDRRSTTLANLFDYLFERASDPRPPKEIEVAIAVFGKSGTFDTSENSTVRSHVHRLRQRLEKFNAGKSGPRLTIPKGEYRLILSEPLAHEEEEEEPQSIEHASPFERMWTKQTAAIVLGLSAILWTLIFLSGASSTPLGQTALWKPITSNGRPTVIAAGDFFLVAESGADGMIERLTMDPAIQSEADLTSHLIANPGQAGKLHDRGIYRVPAVEAKGAMAILNLVSAIRPGNEGAEIIPVSRISQDRADSSNIVYVQYFSQLGTLRSPVLHLSGFAPTDDFNEIRDVASGKIYQARYAAGAGPSTSGGAAASHSYGIDYGYVVSFPGSSGKHDILISGIGDTGLSQMIKLVADKRQLDNLVERTGRGRSFEALYQVRSIGGLVFETKLLVARPLKTDTARNDAGGPDARE